MHLPGSGRSCTACGSRSSAPGAIDTDAAPCFGKYTDGGCKYQSAEVLAGVNIAAIITAVAACFMKKSKA